MTDSDRYISSGMLWLRGDVVWSSSHHRRVDWLHLLRRMRWQSSKTYWERSQRPPWSLLNPAISCNTSVCFHRKMIRMTWARGPDLEIQPPLQYPAMINLIALKLLPLCSDLFKMQTVASCLLRSLRLCLRQHLSRVQGPFCFSG